MNILRFLLFPLASVYWAVTAIRNAFFNLGLFKSHVIAGKSIVVGNLSLGGTGKSPHVNYLIELLSKKHHVATLSRGYGRKTKGLIVGNIDSTSEQIGDEPLMYKTRHGDKIEVISCESRVNGVQFIQSQYPEVDVILLDDAFQHRKVKAGLNVLITEFNHPYFSDWIFPVGRLRESRSGAKRADIVVVSKCPSDLSVEEKEKFQRRISNDCKHVFFSSIQYDNLLPINQNVDVTENVLLVTGIAKPQTLISSLSKKYVVTHLSYPDHHEFNEDDLAKIHKKFDTFATRNKIIVTTEKDLMRLTKFAAIYDEKFPLFIQPITIKMDDEDRFNALITSYVDPV